MRTAKRPSRRQRPVADLAVPDLEVDVVDGQRAVLVPFGKGAREAIGIVLGDVPEGADEGASDSLPRKAGARWWRSSR